MNKLKYVVAFLLGALTVLSFAAAFSAYNHCQEVDIKDGIFIICPSSLGPYSK